MARDAVQQQPSHLSEYFWIFLFIYMIFFLLLALIFWREKKFPFFSLSLLAVCVFVSELTWNLINFTKPGRILKISRLIRCRFQQRFISIIFRGLNSPAG